MRVRGQGLGVRVLAAIAAFLIFCAPDCFAKAKPISAKSALLIDMNKKQVVYAKDPHRKLLPASTVKLMTALVVVEKFSLDTPIKISRNAASKPPSKAYVKKGEEYSVEELLKATLISSANDAACALAEAVAPKGEAEFALLMNKKAKELGAYNTQFANATGLPDSQMKQYSTAYDLVLIMKEASENPAIASIMRKKFAGIQNDDGRTILLKNHNKFLWRLKEPSLIGKTGYTIAAKHCFVGMLDSNGRKYAFAFLGSRSIWDDLERLLKGRLR